MKTHKNIFGRVTGYIISPDEMKTLRKITRQAKGSMLKHNAMNIFRSCDLLEEGE